MTILCHDDRQKSDEPVWIPARVCICEVGTFAVPAQLHTLADNFAQACVAAGMTYQAACYALGFMWGLHDPTGTLDTDSLTFHPKECSDDRAAD